MRVRLESNHRYPFYGGRQWASSEGILLRIGLAHAGSAGAPGWRSSATRYLLREGCDAPLPQGVQLVSDPVAESTSSKRPGSPSANLDVHKFVARHGVPWVLTCHLDRSRSRGALPAAKNWIFASRSLARTYGKERHVYNGIDPADCLFSPAKEDFLLFMAAAERAIPKGLCTALAVSKRTGVCLVVAGTGRSYDAIERISGPVATPGSSTSATSAGPPRPRRWRRLGRDPADRNQRGLSLTLIEALMSGTPVIAGRGGHRLSLRRRG